MYDDTSRFIKTLKNIHWKIYIENYTLNSPTHGLDPNQDCTNNPSTLIYRLFISSFTVSTILTPFDRLTHFLLMVMKCKEFPNFFHFDIFFPPNVGWVPNKICLELTLLFPKKQKEEVASFFFRRFHFNLIEICGEMFEFLLWVTFFHFPRFMFSGMLLLQHWYWNLIIRVEGLGFVMEVFQRYLGDIYNINNNHILIQYILKAALNLHWAYITYKCPM